MPRAAAVLALTLTLARIASAQTASSEAERLFDEARALMTSGNPADACPKFERSQELDPGRGTLINLAACYEATGHLVQALATYREVVAESQPAKDTKREKAANARITALVARIPHLAITAPAGVSVTVNDAAVAPADYGDVLVDPGKVTVVATAPRYQRYETSIDAADGAHAQLTIPPLESTQVDTHVVPETHIVHAERHRDHTRTLIAIGTGGVGVIGFGVSVVLAIGAKGSYDDALRDDCNGAADQCNQAGLLATTNARKKGNLATIIGGAGLAAIAGGVILYLTAPTVETERAALIPQVSSDGAGFALVGSF